MERIILHSDCNSFYASVECLYHPEIRRKPVAVGGDIEQRHGIILAKNQLAKQFNQALTYAKQGTKDLAFIQLRRILSNYPHFVKGYLLLALLYMDNGNNDKAKKAIKRVLRIDKNNTLAVKYLQEMGVAPRDVIGRIGLTENEVLPSKAKVSIFFSGYLDSPASLGARS